MSGEEEASRRGKPPADLTREQALRLMRQLREAARASGILPGDPLHPLVEALAQAIGFLGVQRAALSATVDRATDSVVTVLREGRANAEAEAERFQAQCAATEAETIARIAAGITAAAAAAFAHRVRAFDRRTAVGVALAMLIMGAVGFATGWATHERTRAAVMVEVEHGLQVAFRSPGEAEAWLGLMQWNSATAALSICREPGESRPQSGRLSCRVPLWIEPAPPAAR